jgi:hypothetical protein
MAAAYGVDGLQFWMSQVLDVVQLSRVYLVLPLRGMWGNLKRPTVK